MTADILTRAAQSITERAAEMRAAFPDSSEPGFLDAVAAWLDQAAALPPDFESVGQYHALATARAWLGEDS